MCIYNNIYMFMRPDRAGCEDVVKRVSIAVTPFTGGVAELFITVYIYNKYYRAAVTDARRPPPAVYISII